MLGQPVYLLTPDVVGFELTGQLREGVTATDLVLTVTEILRSEKVVGKFVEFFGAGARIARGARPRHHRQHGARVRRDDGLLPGRREDHRLLQGHRPHQGRDRAFEAYFRAQGMFGVPQAGDIDYTQDVTLDLGTVAPSLAGPKRPQDRIELMRNELASSAKGSRELLLSEAAIARDHGFNQPADDARAAMDDATLDATTAPIRHRASRSATATC